jgi:ketopantoate reductase
MAGLSGYAEERAEVARVRSEVLIVGTGALACLFAARLSAASTAVILLGTWKEGLQALGERGVVVSYPDGSPQMHRDAPGPGAG